MELIFSTAQKFAIIQKGFCHAICKQNQFQVFAFGEFKFSAIDHGGS